MSFDGSDWGVSVRGTCVTREDAVEFFFGSEGERDVFLRGVYHEGNQFLGDNGYSIYELLGVLAECDFEEASVDYDERPDWMGVRLGERLYGAYIEWDRKQLYAKRVFIH